MTDFNKRTPLTRNLTAAEVDDNWAKIAVMSKELFVGTAANQDYTIAPKMPHGGVINETHSKTSGGTCTVTWKINGVALGAANAASSTLQTQAQSTTNTFVAGDRLTVTISANAAALNLELGMKITRSAD